MLAAAAERNHDLLALALQVGNVGLELFGIEAGGRVELHGPFRRVFVRRGEGDDDDVPLRRDLAERDGGTGAAVAGPVADELMAVAAGRVAGIAATVGGGGAAARPPRSAARRAGLGRRR